MKELKIITKDNQNKIHIYKIITENLHYVGIPKNLYENYDLYTDDSIETHPEDTENITLETIHLK